MSLAAEDRLLLECSRVDLDPDTVERVAALIRGKLDWRYVLESSIRHAVAPLLRRGLCAVDTQTPILNLIPPWVVHDLDELHAGSARRNRRLFAVTAEVTAALEAANAGVLALKELSLAATVYSDPALRPLGDIDLLVRRNEYSIVTRVLRELDFVPVPSAECLYTLAYADSQRFHRQADEVWLDVQWALMHREWDGHGVGTFTYDPQEMWQSAVSIDFDGIPLEVPSPEELLFHLCVHLEGHQYAELILFCDIAQFLCRGPTLDWQKLEAIVRRYRQEGSLYYVLLLVQQLLGTPVPEDTLARLKPHYFHGALLRPLFGNLTSLHFALDDIRLSVDAPMLALRDFEIVARRQAALAMTLDRELNLIALSFGERSGRPMLFFGGDSPRMLPDTSLPAFGEIEAFLLAEDVQHIGAVLRDAGYAPAIGGNWGKRIVIDSPDPVLQGRATSLTVACEIASDLSRAFTDREVSSNTQTPLRSLWGALSAGSVDQEHAGARLTVHALDRDALAVAVLARAARATDHRLFSLCSLLELTRVVGDLNPQPLLALAGELGVASEVAAALDLLGVLVPELEGKANGDFGTSPHLLEWARYGPESLHRLTELRMAYYAALVTLRLRGLPRAGYVARSLFARGRRSLLVRVPAGLGQITLRHLKLRRSRSSVVDLAYWIERDVRSKLAFGPNVDDPHQL